MEWRGPVLTEEGRAAHEIAFKMPNNLPAIAATLSDLFLPDSFIQKIATTTINYAKKTVPANRYKKVTPEEILRFVGIYFYMGVVQLPCKEDYFHSEPGFWPIHPCTAGMSFARYKYIWRTIHLTQKTDDLLEIEDPNLDLPDEEGEEDSFNKDDVPDDPEEELQADTRWYAKAAPIVEKVIEVSQHTTLYQQ